MNNYKFDSKRWQFCIRLYVHGSALGTKRISKYWIHIGNYKKTSLLIGWFHSDVHLGSFMKVGHRL